jgi:hypothetical protein
VDSTDRRNTLGETLGGCLKVERLSWSFVELSSYGVEFVLMDAREIHPFGEVLSQESVGVLV